MMNNKSLICYQRHINRVIHTFARYMDVYAVPLFTHLHLSQADGSWKSIWQQIRESWIIYAWIIYAWIIYASYSFLSWIA